MDPAANRIPYDPDRDDNAKENPLRFSTIRTEGEIIRLATDVVVDAFPRHAYWLATALMMTSSAFSSHKEGSP